MIRIKNLACAFFVTLLASMTTIGLCMANPDTVIYVDPVLSVASPGVTFDIYVTASEVIDLFLGEFSMSFDPAILNVVDISIGDVAPYLDYIYITEWDNTAGWLYVTVGRPIGVKTGLSGTVQIAKITFQVMAEGNCVLPLYDTRLKDVRGIDLEHTIRDGYFTSLYPTLWIRKHGARIYPEWHGGAIDQPQTLYAKIVNTGTGSVYVRVNFTVYSAALGEVHLLSSESEITPGGKVTVSTEYTSAITGTFYVKGVLQFSFDGMQWSDYYEVQEALGGEGISRDVATRFSVS